MDRYSAYKSYNEVNEILDESGSIATIKISETGGKLRYQLYVEDLHSKLKVATKEASTDNLPRMLDHIKEVLGTRFYNQHFSHTKTKQTWDDYHRSNNPNDDDY